MPCASEAARRAHSVRAGARAGVPGRGAWTGEHGRTARAPAATAGHARTARAPVAATAAHARGTRAPVAGAATERHGDLHGHSSRATPPPTARITISVLTILAVFFFVYLATGFQFFTGLIAAQCFYVPVREVPLAVARQARVIPDVGVMPVLCSLWSGIEQ